MCNTDGDHPEFYNRDWHIAKKEHKCSECRRIIKVKEKYSRAIGKWEQRISTFKTCQYCMKAGKWLDRECGGWAHGGLYEELIDHADEFGYRCLYQLATGVAHKWSKYDR